LLVTLFFGGWQLLPGMATLLQGIQASLGLGEGAAEWARIVFEMTSFGIKVVLMMWFYVWVRWTLPRFRYDQLMDLGWKVMFPLALLNILVTGVMVFYGWI